MQLKSFYLVTQEYHNNIIIAHGPRHLKCDFINTFESRARGHVIVKQFERGKQSLNLNDIDLYLCSFKLLYITHQELYLFWPMFFFNLFCALRRNLECLILSIKKRMTNKHKRVKKLTKYMFHLIAVHKNI